MNFEIHNALMLIGDPVDPYLIREAFCDPDITIDITMKRYARQILRDLEVTDATRLLIEKVRLY